MASNTTKNRRAAQRRNASTFGRNSGRKPQPSGLEKAIAFLPIGKKAAPAKSSNRGGTAGKAAMLTAAAGFAYKNRAKLSGLLGKRRQPQQPSA